ncbi:MAG: hypothetical protein RQ735_05175 [Flavobacteriaceae bacterium]|nr:hypothetical protein [Flavobacteriaceae bacterium]
MQKRAYIFVLTVLLPLFSDAQCAMCRAVLESEANKDTAQGINDGIVYLMLFPYLLIGGVLFFVIRSFRKKNQSPVEKTT